jgi:ribosomal protein S13
MVRVPRCDAAPQTPRRRSARALGTSFPLTPQFSFPLPSSRAQSAFLQPSSFQYILRILNTNVDGRVKVMYALTAIPGVGRRISNIICKKAEVDMSKRAGELSADEIEKLVAILTDPKRFNVPEWLLNRRKDKFDGKSSQCVSNQIATKLRDDLEHLKKVRVHRGLRHYWGVKVRGQHTGTTGRGRIAAQLAAERAK